MGLEDKVVLVTGVAGSIGRAIVRSFAGQKSKLVLVRHRKECADLVEELKAKRIAFCVCQADVSKKEDAERIVSLSLEQFGRVDVLVNNAAVTSRGSVETVSEGEWDRVLAVNLKSVFLLCQAVIPSMRKQRSGKIINIGSVLGKSGGNAQPWINRDTVNKVAGACYCVSKAGVHCLTICLAKELAADNITVNAIAPGPILGGMTESFPEELRRLIPLGGLGTPEDVAAACLFLASEAAGYITGEILDVNGGLFMD